MKGGGPWKGLWRLSAHKKFLLSRNTVKHPLYRLRGQLVYTSLPAKYKKRERMRNAQKTQSVYCRLLANRHFCRTCLLHRGTLNTLLVPEGHWPELQLSKSF